MDYDFSTLPDVVWVNVLTRLSLNDRSRVALLCRRLNDVFNHPSVWHSVSVVLIGTLPPGRTRTRHPIPRPGVVAPDRYVAMIRRFGAFFQDVCLTVRGEVHKLEESCREVLEQLASCRLEALTLKVGEGTVQRRELSPVAADALLALVKEAQRLKVLHVRTWPVDPSCCDLVGCLGDNEKLRRLERLSLFCRDPAEDGWVPLTTRLPTPDSIASLVDRLSSLTSLSVHSGLLTTKLLHVLCQSRRTRLCTLGVMVAHKRAPAARNYDATFPRIDDSTWKKLRQSCPSVGVELTFCNTIPSWELMSLLSAELPLKAVTFMRYSSYKPDVLTCLAANYHRTLVKFADYGDAEYSDKEEELGEMVRRCSGLRCLVTHGAVRPSTVLALASDRGRGWNRFEVGVRWTLDHDVGEDEVLCVHPDMGSVAIAAHLPGSAFYHDDASRLEMTDCYQSLCERVSHCLGYKWRPLNKPSFD